MLDASDNGKMGVHTTVVDAKGNVHFYYMGDGGNQPSNMNNLRHALSTDGGDGFDFENNDVCGDLGVGGFNTMVDPDAVLLDNGDIRMFVMNPHGANTPPSVHDPISTTIHAFYSSDNGMTFTQETKNGSDTIMDCQAMGVHSLNDPKVIQLPDGRTKVFVNGLTFIGDSTFSWNIYSFTSLAPSTVSQVISVNMRVYPNPAHSTISIDAQEIITMYNNLGETILQVEPNEKGSEISIINLEPGLYFLTSPSGQSQKLIII